MGSASPVPWANKWSEGVPLIHLLPESVPSGSFDLMDRGSPGVQLWPVMPLRPVNAKSCCNGTRIEVQKVFRATSRSKRHISGHERPIPHANSTNFFKHLTPGGGLWLISERPRQSGLRWCVP